MTQDETPGSSEDPFVVAVRQYILDTLSPLIPTGEQTGRFMYGLLRRALRTATREDLEQVVLHCVAFTDGLRAQGFITEELAREAQSYLQPGAIHDAIPTDTYDDTGDGITYDRFGQPIEDLRDSSLGESEVQRQSPPDWTDEEWQEHASQASYSDLPTDDESGAEKGVGASTDTGSGHQATMEGDDNPNGEVGTEAVQEDGAG